MITDTNSAAPRELNDESYSSIGRGGPVLEVDKVTRLYPSEPPVTALRGVSFTVDKGELVGGHRGTLGLG